MPIEGAIHLRSHSIPLTYANRVVAVTSRAILNRTLNVRSPCGALVLCPLGIQNEGKIATGR